MYYKVGQVLLQSEAALTYCKAGKVILQSRACVAKWGNFVYKLRQVSQSRATFITK